MEETTSPTLTSMLDVLARESALMTTKEVSTVTNLTGWWVRQHIASGELRAINVGTGSGTSARWRVDPEDLKAFLISRESRPRDLVASR